MFLLFETVFLQGSDFHETSCTFKVLGKINRSLRGVKNVFSLYLLYFNYIIIVIFDHFQYNQRGKIRSRTCTETRIIIIITEYEHFLLIMLPGRLMCIFKEFNIYMSHRNVPFGM